MNLVNTELNKTNGSDKQVFIASFNGENNILMECASAAEAKEWETAIEAHIVYANQQTEEIVRSSRRYEVPPVPTNRDRSSTTDTLSAA